jgi:hypothetical protein
MLQTLATMFRYDSCGNKEERARTILGPYSVLKKEGTESSCNNANIIHTKEKSTRNGKS